MELPEFLVGGRNYPDSNWDTWETMSNLAGSENMTDEFNRWWEDQYEIRTPETL